MLFTSCFIRSFFIIVRFRDDRRLAQTFEIVPQFLCLCIFFCRLNNYCYANQGKWLELPSKIQGVPVTRIGNEAFSYKGSSSYKNGLWIPDCVKEIGHGAFYNSEFYAIHLPEGLEEIPGAYDGYEGCFYSCEAVSINIPSSVKWIGDGAFQYCSVEEVSIPAGCIIGKAALASCKIKKLTFPKGRIYLTDSIYKYGRDVYSEGYGWGQPNIGRCNYLETIVAPKELDILYDGSTKTYTLADFISGDKIDKSFALQKQLKSIAVRSKTQVEEEEEKALYEKNLALYNNALAAKDYEKAKSIAESNKWADKVLDVNCILYFPALAEKVRKLSGTVEKKRKHDPMLYSPYR